MQSHRCTAAKAAFVLLTVVGATARADAEDPATLAARAACEGGIAIALAGTTTLSPAAVAACHKVYLTTWSARDMGNKASALMLEKARPDLDTVALASLIADATVKKAPEEPWGHLARYDLARALGRADLLAASRTALQPFAASEPRARAALVDRTGRAPIWIWLLRILVLLGLAATGVDAFLRRRRDISAGAGIGQPTSAPKSAAAVVLTMSLMLSSSAWAGPDDPPSMKNGQMSRYTVDDAHPEEALKKLVAETKNPLDLGYLLQDYSAAVSEAKKQGDHARAARYYHAMGMAVRNAYAPRLECESYEAIGDFPNAIRACRELLTRPGVEAQDYARFVELVLKNPKSLPALEPKELEGVIAHLEKEAKLSTVPAVLRCKVAMRFEEPGSLERCAATMNTLPANDPTVISIKWGLAVRRNDSAAALLLIEQAQKAGVRPEVVDRMRETTSSAKDRRFRNAGIIGGLTLIAVALVIVGIRLLNASRQRNRMAV